MRRSVFKELVLWSLIAGALVVVLYMWSQRPFWRRFDTSQKYAKYFPDGVDSQLHAGKAEQISDYWYGGQYVPGFYTTPIDQKDTSPPPDHREAVNRVISLFRADLIFSQKKEVNVDDIMLKSYSKRLWLDSQLGCALPGEIVVGAKVPGWLFALSYAPINDRLFIYHSNNTGSQAKFCRTMMTSEFHYTA